MDVVLLFLLLPKYGMRGYFFSFFITHVINFGFSLGLLLKTTGLKIPLRIPALAAGSFLLAVQIGAGLPTPATKTLCFLLSGLILLRWFGVLRKEDGFWLLRMVWIEKKTKKANILKNNI